MKFQGVTIESTLSWSEHMRITKNRVAKGVGILTKGTRSLGKSTLTIVYNSFIYLHLLYGTEGWGTLSRCHFDPLLKLQKILHCELQGEYQTTIAVP